MGVQHRALKVIPWSSIFASAYHDALLLCIFLHFHVYMIENIPLEKGQLTIFFFFLHRHSKLFFFFFLQRHCKTFFFPIGRQSPGCAVKVECNYPSFFKG